MWVKTQRMNILSRASGPRFQGGLRGKGETMQRMGVLSRAGGPRFQRPGWAGYLPATLPASVSPHLPSFNLLPPISYLLLPSTCL